MGNNNKITAGGIYFITLTVVDWVDVFTRPVYKHILVEALQFYQKNKGLEIYAWCLMSNHLHLIVSAGAEGNLSNILRDLKGYTSRKIVAAIQEAAESRREWMLHRFSYAAKFHSKVKSYKFWQDGNEVKEIISNSFMEQKLDYIHQNPVRAEWVQEPEHYLYSSAINYAGSKGLLDVVLVE